jgi:hypothetical protein
MSFVEHLLVEASMQSLTSLIAEMARDGRTEPTEIDAARVNAVEAFFVALGQHVDARERLS